MSNALRPKNKVLDTEVIRLCRQMERMGYEFYDKWKKSYRYTLVSDFRQDLREIRVNIIKAYTTDKRLPAGKLYYYGKAKGALANAECDMEHMVGNPVNAMSYSQWADFAEIMDKVSGMVDKLVSTLEKSQPLQNMQLIPYVFFDQ